MAKEAINQHKAMAMGKATTGMKKGGKVCCAKGGKATKKGGKC